ncbi:reverse transcriptase domain-containing protein [Tanacetum coccineum]
MSDMTACLNDLSYIPPNNEQNEPTQGDISETSNEPTQAIRNEFEELYASTNEELYPGCGYVTRLDFKAKFTYFKVKGKLTDSIFNEMLEFFQNVFPITKGNKLPPSYYAIKMTFKMIGLGYELIHSCINDCFLFWGEDHKDKQFCPVCNTSIWKDSNTSGKKVPKKVLRYFLIIPRLQRLYKSSHTTKEMTWHATGKCIEPGKMQHPVDDRVWKIYDTKYPNFTKEPRNVRLGLAADGFNRFGNLSQSYNMWPVILTTYNLPPWRSLDFNVEIKDGDPPRKFDRDDIMAQLARLPTRVKGKHLMCRGVKIKCNVLVELNWTKRSIFYELEYWSFLTLKHKLDVMHIEKNVLESILNTLLMNDKSKDTTKARQDLKRLGIRSGLWLGQNKNEKYTKPQDDMLKAQSKVVDILCNLELVYPPSFFDIMIHLVIHLSVEALEGGPIRPRSVCKSIGLRSIIRIDHQELKKVIWYALHNSPEIDTYRVKFKSQFPNKDMKEEFPGCRDERPTTQNNGICSPGEDGEMYYGQLKEILEFSYMSFKTVLFRVKWFDTSNKGRVKHLVIRNNIIQILENEDDPDIIHVDNSSDLALITSLNDLEIAALHIDGQSIDVDAPPDIIDVNEDDDIIDDEYVLPHDLEDSDDEDLVNVDDDDGVDVVYSYVRDVARGHNGDGGGDDRPPPHQLAGGCRGKGTQKLNLGGRKAGRMHTRKETRNLELRKITDELGPQPIRFEWKYNGTMLPLDPVDLKLHMQSELWPEIRKGIDQHLGKIYTDNKSSLKRDYWVKNLDDETYDVEAIICRHLVNISTEDWDEQIRFWSDPKNLARSVRNPSVSTAAGVATGDGTVKGIIGDEMGNGSSDGDEEMGSEPDVYSGERGVCTGGAGGG